MSNVAGLPIQKLGSDSDSDGNAKTKRPLRRRQSNTEVTVKTVDVQTMTPRKLSTPVVQTVAKPVVTHAPPTLPTSQDGQQKQFVVCL